MTRRDANGRIRLRAGDRGWGGCGREAIVGDDPENNLKENARFLGLSDSFRVLSGVLRSIWDVGKRGRLSPSSLSCIDDWLRAADDATAKGGGFPPLSKGDRYP